MIKKSKDAYFEALSNKQLINRRKFDDSFVPIFNTILEEYIKKGKLEFEINFKDKRFNDIFSKPHSNPQVIVSGFILDNEMVDYVVRLLENEYGYEVKLKYSPEGNSIKENLYKASITIVNK